MLLLGSLMFVVAPSPAAGSSLGRFYGQDSVPVVGALVTAWGPEGSGFAGTDSSGVYRITEGLKSGTYTVLVIARGYLNAQREGVSVMVGEETLNVDFYLQLSGAISGRVSDATSGAAVANIVVMALSSDGEYSWWALTDSNGNYLIETNLATGTYNVTAFFPEGYVSKTISGVEVTGGAETTGVDLALEPSGVISGAVTATDGSPLANATVAAMSEDGRYYGFATTDVGGNYRISTGLGTGTYTVFATYETGFAQVADVELVAGEETSGVDFVIDVPPPTPSGGVSGKVTDDEGNPIKGASVTASGPEGYGSAETDKDGNYLIFEGLGTGTYTVEAFAAGFVSQSITDVEVEVGKETKNVNFQLERVPPEESGIISGTVLGPAREERDTAPPVISDISHSPEVPDENETVTVTLTVTDVGTGVKSVTLEYSVGDGPWEAVPMGRGGGDVWSAAIPGQPADTAVRYRVVAEDRAGNVAVEDRAGEYYSYTVVPEFATWALLFGALLALAAFVIALKRKSLTRPSLPGGFWQASIRGRSP